MKNKLGSAHPIVPPNKRISNDMIMSFIALGVTLPFTLLNVVQRKNKYFRIFGGLGVAAAMIYQLDAIEEERKRIREEQDFKKDEF